MMNARLLFESDEDRDAWHRARAKVVVLPHSVPFLDGVRAVRAVRSGCSGGCSGGRTDVAVYARWWPAWLRLLAPRWCVDVSQGRGDDVGAWVQAEAGDLLRRLRYTGFCRIAFPSGGRGPWRTGAFRIALLTGAALFAAVLLPPDRSQAGDERGRFVMRVARVTLWPVRDRNTDADAGEPRRLSGSYRALARRLRDEALAATRSLVQRNRFAPGLTYRALNALGAYSDEALFRS